jgi:hypothetical protein
MTTNNTAPKVCKHCGEPMPCEDDCEWFNAPLTPEEEAAIETALQGEFEKWK